MLDITCSNRLYGHNNTFISHGKFSSTLEISPMNRNSALKHYGQDIENRRIYQI